MKLYSFPAAPNPRRLHIYLAEKGIELPFEAVDLMKGEQFGAAFLAVNPESTVPALVTDEGPVLTQVVAIIDYLEARYPANPLLGATPLEKGMIREWSTRIYAEGLASVAEAFRNGNPAFAGRSVTGQVKCEQIPALVERGVKRLLGFYAMLDAHLAGREFICCDRFTMADIDGIAAVDFAGWIKQKPGPEFANLARWYAGIAARPSTKG